MMMDIAAHSAGRTLPLTVAHSGIGFLLDRLGQDCDTLQFLRELTQNAIEAIQRTGEEEGEIIWDVDWLSLDASGIFKLCIVDTGDGMTGPEMVTYINQLSSSTSEQSFMGNYGVGAKIAAATRNHAGLIYLSWKQDKGALIHLWRDPRTGEYGLKQSENPDGTFSHYAAIENEVKPSTIGTHGTKIVLMGKSDDENTMRSPDGVSSPSRWIAKYLNSRYFRFPEGITVRAREGWTLPLSHTSTNILRKVWGQEDYLKKHSSASGTVLLTDATAYWWILRDEDAISQNSGSFESSGHVAALYKDELYELISGRAAMAMLQQFGIIFGHKRVVIYVAPATRGLATLTTNTARTQLLLNNERLPWTEWAAEFRERLPEQIQNLIEEVASGSLLLDHKQSIRERLKPIMELFRLSRYRPTPRGNVNVDETSMTLIEPEQGSSQAGNTSTQRPKDTTAGGIYAGYLKKDGIPAQDVTPDIFPNVTWITIEDGTRVQGQLEDRAAQYLFEQNQLLINGDFRVFTDMVEKWCREYNNAPGVSQIATDVVHSWFEQTLIETVIGIRALQNSRQWSSVEVRESLSEQALTTAVMARYHVNNQVKRDLGSKLGKQQAT